MCAQAYKSTFAVSFNRNIWIADALSTNTCTWLPNQNCMTCLVPMLSLISLGTRTLYIFSARHVMLLESVGTPTHVHVHVHVLLTSAGNYMYQNLHLPIVILTCGLSYWHGISICWHKKRVIYIHKSDSETDAEHGVTLTISTHGTRMLIHVHTRSLEHIGDCWSDGVTTCTESVKQLLIENVVVPTQHFTPRM